MGADLPPALKAALDRELEGVGRKDLAGRAQRTSAAYRAGQGSAGVVREDADALAYALTRLPATFAACQAVFAEAKTRAEGFAPASLLDAGAGTAAASWAAAQAWPALATLTWLDSNPAFLSLAGRLGAGALQATPFRADLTAPGEWPHADLVVASYALAEIAPRRQADVVARLWGAADGMLALVEPGTPAGFGRLRLARGQLLTAGAEILAPCPHGDACPIAGEDWCHFQVRLPRSRDHRLAKGADVPFEDEPFAYLLAVRPGIGRAARGRIVGHPRAGKAGVDLRLCTPQGLERRHVPRRDKPVHALARRAAWGEAWE